MKNKVLNVKTKLEAIALVKKSGGYFQMLPERFQDDEEILLIALKQDSLAFEFASARLKDNREIVLEVIKINPRMLMHASEGLSNDDEMRALAFKRYGSPFIVNKDAFREFNRLDNKLINETTRVEEGADGKLHEVYDEEKMKESAFYQRFEKYYNSNPLNPISADEIRKLEKWLLTRREKRLEAAQKAKDKKID